MRIIKHKKWIGIDQPSADLMRSLWLVGNTMTKVPHPQNALPFMDALETLHALQKLLNGLPFHEAPDRRSLTADCAHHYDVMIITNDGQLDIKHTVTSLHWVMSKHDPEPYSLHWQPESSPEASQDVAAVEPNAMSQLNEGAAP